MKRLLSVILVIAMIFSLSSCKLWKRIFGKDTQETMHTPMNYNGVSIKDYQIVYDHEGLDYNARAAEYIRAAIQSVTGFSPAVVDDSAEKKDREIVVGETSRDISKELNREMPGVQFSMLTKDGSVALEGNYFVIAAAAYYFVDTYVKAGDVTIENQVLVREPIQKTAKNVILLIGDGMGPVQTKLFDYVADTSGFSDGESLFYGYMLPNYTEVQTKSYSGTTDSAAAGTALATGYKTSNRHLGVDINNNELKSITELAMELGKATAIMSTDGRDGATPAAFTTHVEDRGSSTEIKAQQMDLVNSTSILINCGFESFAPNTVKNSIDKQIDATLNRAKTDTDGLFLMYEEAHIDKFCDDPDLEGAFKAVLRFNQAIARFMEFAFYNPDTMVIITADHETGGLHIENGTPVFEGTEHTDTNVPLFAWGQGTEFFSQFEVIENINVAQFMAAAMGVEGFGDQSIDWFYEIYGDGKELPIIPI